MHHAVQALSKDRGFEESLSFKLLAFRSDTLPEENVVHRFLSSFGFIFDFRVLLVLLLFIGSTLGILRLSDNFLFFLFFFLSLSLLVRVGAHA